MQRIAFVSDFDGTLSLKDLYHLILENYLGEAGKAMYTQWIKSNKINVAFLNQVFSSVSWSEERWHEEILKIPVDAEAFRLIADVKSRGWDFYVLSAGTSYYIHKLFAHYGIRDVSVTSMEGRYENGAIRIYPDIHSPFYSEVFGIDKGKFIQKLKESYDWVLFAGDSEPDLAAAKAADLAFAKAQLQTLLQAEGADFVPIRDFSDVRKTLEAKGWFA